MISGNTLLRFVGFLFLVLIAGCCTVPNNSGPPSSDEPRCDANGPPNSESIIRTACKFIVQTKDVCIYDNEGRLQDIKTKPDGACFCLGTPF